jgi:hypothetical protein
MREDKVGTFDLPDISLDPSKNPELPWGPIGTTVLVGFT